MKKSKWSSYVGSFVAIAIEIAIALLVLTIGEGKFQHAVIGMLVAIYAQVRFVGFGLSTQLSEVERSNQARLVLMATVEKSGTQVDPEDLRSAVHIYKEKAREDWITPIGLMVIFFAAAYRLVTSAL